MHAREIEPALAEMARENLAERANVSVEHGGDIEPADVIYASCGVTHPPPAWLAALRPGGRMLVPLTAHVPNIPHGVGMMLKITRRDDGWPADIVTPVAIYDCAGARDDDAEAQVLAALARTDIHALAVEPGPHVRGERCLVHVDGACVQRA